MTQILRLRSGGTIEVTEREWELLRALLTSVIPLMEAYSKLPDDAKRTLHELARSQSRT